MSNEEKSSRYLTGIVLLAAGFLLLAYKMGAPIPGWLFSWPMILITLSILFGIRQGFRNIGWIIMLIVGSIGLIDKISPGLDFKHYMAPIIIIGVGAWFLLRPRTNWNKGKRSVKEWNNDQWEQKSTNHEVGEVNDSEFLRISSVFSGFKRTIISKNFQGGDIACVFGGAEVDLSQSDIQGTVTIKIEQVFGGTKLIIPPHWRMINDIEGVFHGVDDRRSTNSSVAIDPNKTLVLKGSVVFGGIDVRSY